MAEWVKREFGKGEIDRAGALLAPWWVDPQGSTVTPEMGIAYRVVLNWRASHAMPLLTFRIGLSQRATRIAAKAIVAQRMKRISSIMGKLAREPMMKLSQMQDLGGCRAIVPELRQVDQLFNLYRESSSGDLFTSEGPLRCYDYIQAPKADGYRGIHVVGRYRARARKNEHWNGHRIEIQLRTRLQHAFSTAVETVTTFTRDPLKFGGGPDDWRRFFALMGSALAIRENTPLVPGTPIDGVALIGELRELSKELRVRERLRGWAEGLRALPRHDMTNFKWLLLALDTDANTIKVEGYASRQKASEAIASLEQEKKYDAVLVWVKSARDLRAAYPNYYADTGGFLEAMAIALRTRKAVS